MTVYKITDKYMETGYEYKSTIWKIGVPVEPGKSKKPDVHKWLYAYEHPLLAVLHNPIHGNYANGYRLFEAEAEGKIETKGQMTLRCTKLTLIKEIKVPKITQEQSVVYGILCAKALLDKTWYTWATNWLSGKYRSKNPGYFITELVRVLNDVCLQDCIIQCLSATIANWVSRAIRETNTTIDLVELAKQALAINSTEGSFV